MFILLFGFVSLLFACAWLMQLALTLQFFLKAMTENRDHWKNLYYQKLDGDGLAPWRRPDAAERRATLDHLAKSFNREQ